MNWVLKLIARMSIRKFHRYCDHCGAKLHITLVRKYRTDSGKLYANRIVFHCSVRDNAPLHFYDARDISGTPSYYLLQNYILKEFDYVISDTNDKRLVPKWLR